MQFTHGRAAPGLVAVALLAALAAAGAGHAAAAQGPGGGDPSPIPAVAGAVDADLLVPAPLTTTQCLTQFAIRCYSPLQYRQAYDLNPVYARGITGAGRTIVIVDSFGSPTIRQDLAVFDAHWGLPPADLDIDRFGTIPPFDPTNQTMVIWASETTLDVEYAHAIAPGARIVLAETPIAETEGVTGFPQMMDAERTLIDQGVPDVISQSFGATENTFPGFARGDFRSLLSLRYAFEDALRHRVTVVAGTSDLGATDTEQDGATPYPFPVTAWPSSDPLVTSVGGSQLYLDDAGNRLQPDTVWNDAFGAGGGGLSGVFSRPNFQDDVAGTVGDHRGTPDISMTAAVNGAAWIYESFITPGWGVIGGTSEATPVFAGVVALADQAAGHRLGDLNPALYRLGGISQHHANARTGIVDITSGDNTFDGVTGFQATRGYDLASGWGTIDAAAFIRAIARW